MATKLTKELKLAQIEEARKCYEEADRLIKKADKLIGMHLRNVKTCGHDEFEAKACGPYKGMIQVHLFSGITKLEKLLEVKTEPHRNLLGEENRDRKSLCVGGIEFMQIGEATQSRYCYK